MTGWSHPVATFWAGPPLCFLEQMVLASYVAQGARITVYSPHPLRGLPPGVQAADSATIMPMPDFVGPAPTRKQLAVWSDLFRIELLARMPVIWVDADAYCLAPYDFPAGYGFGANEQGTVLTGVLAIPPEAQALAMMRQALRDRPMMPPWVPAPWLNKQRRRGNPLGPADLRWGDTGPAMVTHALRETGVISHATARSVFYPLVANELARLWTPGLRDDRIALPGSLSVHLFGFTRRWLATHSGGLPPPGSWLDRAAARHGIDPTLAPADGELLTPKA